MSNGLSRRNFVKYASGAAGSAALAGCSGGGGDGEGARPFKFLTIAPFGTEPAEKKYESINDIEVDRTVDSIPATQQKMHSGGASDFDLMSLDASIAGDLLFESDPPLLERVSVDDLPRWDTEKMTGLLTNPSERVPGLKGQSDDIDKFMWGPDGSDSKDELALPPFNFNFDAIGSNPKFVDPERVAKWGDMFREEFSGQVAMQTTTPHAILETISYLMDTGQMEQDVSQMNDPTQDQLDQAIDFLVKQKQAGQFRSTWTQYGEAVSLFTNEEAVIGDIWQPVVLSVRRQGSPCRYHNMDSGIQGFRFWYGGMNPTSPGASDRNNVEEAHSYLDMHHGAWYPGHVQAQFGFYVPQFPNKELVRDGEDETGKGMGPEYYDWAHEGTATYEPIDSPYTFDPKSYDWSMEEGEPDPDGAVRDAGTIEDKVSRTRFFQKWPSNGTYMLEQWKTFLNA